ncbi:Uncharacterized protein dnm_055880 [Desulfonema magnum]|uniref:Uncharacterized protein n=1 Tax=Desulfonema magnum TaxID=45655 RepID=A0A975GQ54_9BACT|nr:Uncharacterized protein dnm_055880 [Desulfonema magnum]
MKSEGPADSHAGICNCSDFQVLSLNHVTVPSFKFQPIVL